MHREIERWECRERRDGPPGFRFAVTAGDDLICWVRNLEEAEFIARTREVIPRLVDEISLLMSGIDGIRNFMQTLDSNLIELDSEMKKRL